MNEGAENIKRVFNPHELMPDTDQPKYERVADLPDTVRANYVDLPDGGFVRKTAKKLFDKKSEELKKMGLVSKRVIEKNKHDHVTEKGLGVSTKEYLRRLKQRIVDSIVLNGTERAKKEEVQHVQDVVSKIRQDEADPLANGSEFSVLKNEIESVNAQIDDQIALNEPKNSKAIEQILKSRIKEELTKLDRERKSKEKKVIPHSPINKKKEREMLDELG